MLVFKFKPTSLVTACAVAGVLAAGGFGRLSARAREPQAGTQASANATVKRQDFIRSVRLSGTVEAGEGDTNSGPRPAGQEKNPPRHHRAVQGGEAGAARRPPV